MRSKRPQLAASRTHHYVRDDTSSLFASVEVAIDPGTAPFRMAAKTLRDEAARLAVVE